MGEILRAVLDATAIDSNPAWYQGSITSTTVGPAARALVRRQTTLQTKSEAWFLLMGWTQDVAILAAGGPFWEEKTFPTQFLIQDLRTTETLGDLPIQHSNAGYNGNNIVTLPHYYLFPPDSLIGFIMDVPAANPVATTQAQTFVTFAGIEYRMPPGKG